MLLNLKYQINALLCIALVLALGCTDGKRGKSKILIENEEFKIDAKSNFPDIINRKDTFNSKNQPISKSCVFNYNAPLINRFTNFQYSLHDSLNLGNGFVSCFLRVDNVTYSPYNKSGLFLNTESVPIDGSCFLEPSDSGVVIHIFSMRHEITLQINGELIYQADITNYDGQNKSVIFNPTIPIAKLNDSFIEELW